MAVSRKDFLKLGMFGTGALLLPFGAGAQKDKGPALKPELVKEFVGAAHRDLSKVQLMLEAEPGLVNAAWDWGGGDFETALEAAGHVGNRDIAGHLLSKGARMNVFCAAMLGQLELVKALLQAYPELKHSKGPHGLQLVHHALKGGDDAKSVLDYLRSIGAS